jgi:DNA-binding transcriptional LysR family regulator
MNHQTRSTIVETRTLQLFLETVHQGSFAAVARQHGVDPSSVSRAMSQLEHEVKTRLFHRSTRQLSLTDAGQLLYERVQPLLETLQETLDQLTADTDQLQGTLRLTASVAFAQVCLVPLLPPFRAQFPSLKLDLILSDTNLDLIAERIDLAIRLAPQVSGDLITRKLCSTRYHLAAAPSWLDAHPTIQTPQDISKYDCLRLPFSGFRDRWLFRKNQDSEIFPVAVDGSITLSNPASLRDAAIAGLGPTLLADWLCCDPLAQGSLVQILPEYEVCATTFDTGAWLVYPNRNYLPKKVTAMMSFLKEKLGNQK